MKVYPKTNKSETAAEKLYNDFMMCYDIPENLGSGKRTEFEDELYQQLSKFYAIKKICTKPYHPQTNGQLERMNQNIISMLKCLPEQYKSNWRDHLNKLVHVYNSTKTLATGYSTSLPIDVLLPSQSNHAASYPEYANKTDDQMRQAYQTAKNHSEVRKMKDINEHDT